MSAWAACLVISICTSSTGALTLVRDKVAIPVGTSGALVQDQLIAASVKYGAVTAGVQPAKNSHVTSKWQCHSYVAGQSDGWCSQTRFEGGFEFSFNGGQCGSCSCCKKVLRPYVAAQLRDQAAKTPQGARYLMKVPQELTENQIKVEDEQQQEQEAFPKIIHQTWKDTKLPSDFERWSRSWKECLPDWEYKLHTDTENRDFIKEHFPEFLETYDGYDAPIKRVDAARYAYLAVEGGLYVDLDIECVRDPQQLFGMGTNGTDGTSRADLILSWEAYSNDGQLSNAFMLALSNKGREFFRNVVGKLNQTASDYVLEATGPAFLTKRVDEYLLDTSSTQDAVQGTNAINYRPLFGSVKTLNKLGTKLAVADDALIFNIPWYDLDDKQNCANSAWCREHYPYALSVSHWSSSWLPEINSVSAGGSKDFVRTYTLDDKKCAKGANRIFKIIASELPGELDVLDVCGRACGADPDCKFFGLLRQQWCIGCKDEPADTHDGFETYRLSSRIVSNKRYDEKLDSYSSGQKFSRVYSLDGKMCGTEEPDRLFQIMDVPKDVDELAYCSLACEYNPDCNFFSLMKDNWCMGCSASPNVKQESAIQTYKVSGQGDVSGDLPSESVHLFSSQRGSSESGVFSRAFALDNKKCPAESSDRLFRIDGFDGEAEQVFRCSEACTANPECKYFTVEVKSRMCIGCKAQPSEDADGFWAYKWVPDAKPAPQKSMAVNQLEAHRPTRNGHDLAPLIQAGETAHRHRTHHRSSFIKNYKRIADMHRTHQRSSSSFKPMIDEEPDSHRPTRNGHDLAPLIQADVHRTQRRSHSIQTFKSTSKSKFQQVCTCFTKGLAGTPSVMCQKSLRQQLGHFKQLSNRSSPREVYRGLLDLHMRWC